MGREFKDLRQGQSYLQYIVERKGIPIFDQIEVGLDCVARILREGIKPQELCRKDSATPVRTSDKLIRLREVFDSLDIEKKGEITLTDLKLAFRTLTDRELSNNSLHNIAIAQIGGLNESDSELRTINSDDIRVNFDEFCCIVTEFKSQTSPQISTNEKLGPNIVSKLEVIFEPISRPFEWLLKPVNSAFKSSHSPQHIPYDHAHYSDIYLGGSASQSCTWRDDIAIPLLRSAPPLLSTSEHKLNVFLLYRKYGLTYFSSQSEGLRSEDRIPIETTAVEKSRILLFVITNKTRALSAMILVSLLNDYPFV